MDSVTSGRRLIHMLEAVMSDGGQSSVSAIARSIDIPIATAHRHVATLVSEGYLMRNGNRRHAVGPRLMRLLQLVDEKQIIANASAPVLHELADQLGCVVQLGTLENDMVTYRIKTGKGAKGLFTKVGMQLEAYCSAIGKVLLAHLPDTEKRAYLASGPFVALTPRTITDPTELAAELSVAKQRGYALDLEEAAAGLICAAVPIRSTHGQVPAAISASQIGESRSGNHLKEILQFLTDAAERIEQEIFERKSLQILPD